MKNKDITKIISLSSAGFLLMMVFLYFLTPELAVSINRSLEMIKSGSAKGLMMIYYQFGNLAFLFALLTQLIQQLALVFDNASVAEAVYGFFDPLSAKALLVFGGLLGSVIAYGIGNGLRGSLLKTLKLSQKAEYALSALLLAALGLGPGLIYLCFYGAGFLRLDVKKVLAASTLGLLIFY